jgi:hypothetical protein
MEYRLIPHLGQDALDHFGAGTGHLAIGFEAMRRVFQCHHQQFGPLRPTDRDPYQQPATSHRSAQEAMAFPNTLPPVLASAHCSTRLPLVVHLRLNSKYAPIYLLSAHMKGVD